MVSNKNTRVQITMPKELYKLLNQLAKDNNITISTLVNITIVDYLEYKMKNFKENKEIKENGKNI